MLHPNGAFQGYSSSAGMYLYGLQNFMVKMKPLTEMYRPGNKLNFITFLIEIYNREISGSLHLYSKRIQQLKKDQPEAVSGAHYPSQWH